MDWNLLLDGVLMTLRLTFLSWALSLSLGVVIAVLRIAPNAFLQWIGSTYTEFFRNIPLLVLLFFFYYGLPKLGSAFRFSAVNCAIFGLGLYTAAYVAEITRSGFNAVSKGNLEAARSLGLNFIQSVRYVQLPQALRTAIPPLGTLFLALIRNTAIAQTITVGELLFQADVINSRTFDADVFLIAGGLYLAMIIPLAILVNVLEQRWAIKR